VNDPQPAGIDRPDFFADALGIGFRDDPYSVIARYRRAEGPVRVVDGLWVVARHEDAQAVLRSPTCSSDERRSRLAPSQGVNMELALTVEALLLFLDPPDHTRLRRLVLAAFTPKVVEHLKPRLDALVEESLDRMETSAAQSPDGSADLIADLAYPLPVQIICELLGVPPEDEARFGRWSRDMGASLDPAPLRTPEINDAIARATEELVAYLADLFDRLRAEPDNALISALLVVESEGERLSQNELLHLTFLLLIAGHETTVGLIANAINALSAHPDQWNLIVSDPSVLDAGMDELLRLDGPVQMVQRTTLMPMTLGDVELVAGDQILVMLGGSNRDPAFVDAPDELDLRRGVRNHVAFGGGIHHCLGAALAKMEAQAAIAGLARRFPNLRVAEPGRRRAAFVLRGFEELRVRW
jgi:cytochrome P450